MQVFGTKFSNLKKSYLNKETINLHKKSQQSRRKKVFSPSANVQNTEQAKKIINDLNRQLKEEKRRRERVQIQLKQSKEKLVMKQIEFRNILKKYQSEKIVLNHSNLQQMYNLIQQNLNNGNIQSQRWLEQKYNQNLKLMERRIQQIKTRIENESEKRKKVSLQSYNEIISEIQQIKNIAINVDQENMKLFKEIKDVKVKNMILMEQRNLLIQQIIQKKHYIKKFTNTNTSRDPRNSQRDPRKSQRVHTSINYSNKFIGQPTITSIHKNTFNSVSNQQEMVAQKQEKAQNAVSILKRNLLRQKKKNQALSSLFNINTIKNRQLNQILWQCIQLTKKDVENEKFKESQFHIQLIKKLATTQKLFNKIKQFRHLMPQNHKIDNFIQEFSILIKNTN